MDKNYFKEYNRRLYNHRKKQHLCHYCSTVLPEGCSQIGCVSCRKKKTEDSGKRYRERLKNKLCAICGKPNNNNKVYCDKCRGLNKKRQPHKSKYLLKRNREGKIKVVKLFGGKCLQCGLETDKVEVYDFHHKDPSIKDNGLGNYYHSKKVINELKKCLLVCSNCHRTIHYNLRNNLY